MVDALISEIQEEFAAAYKVKELDDVLDWVTHHRRIFDKQAGAIVYMDFETRPWLRDIYRDLITPGMEMIIMKARQMEISTAI